MLSLVLTCLSLLRAAHGGHLQQEAAEGATVTLPCFNTTDGQHQFQFWMLKDDSVIGPENPPSPGSKFKFEVLSGNLSIKALSAEDSGLYRCVAKGWNNPTFHIEDVDLIVRKDWEEVWANDTGVNILRGVLALTVICVFCGVACVLLRLRRSSYLKSEDLSDEDEESPFQSTSEPGQQHRRLSSSNVEINVLETELPRTLNSMYRAN
ncbi:uncharacterized protein LOC132200482 [Neocloeon triangulifer]|uniref:uncharacterized protein LOC132200482 n=1 Tax=Neocloeon triangulifer TaxID=2078957 RepID=UPI00286F2DA6|nr:uncharacterized protein LOC132200482 [Neocloeon triangulifer]XP_059481952.1 uncharacterized protein LOC132200482 [Neocloeon triangulifer]